MEGIPVQPMLEYAPKVSSKCFYLAIRISCSMEPSVESMVWDLVIQRNKKRHLSTVLYLFLVTVSSRHGFLRHQKVLTAKWWLRKKKSSKYKTPSNESYKSSLHCPSVFSIDKFWVWTKTLTFVLLWPSFMRFFVPSTRSKSSLMRVCWR